MDAVGERDSVPHAVPPRRVGGYEIVASLGRGGAGEAFLALTSGSSDFRKLVVLKLLHPELEESLEVVDQFLDEARLAARLSHPNIVPTLEVGRHESQHYIAMAYLEGMPLGRVLSMLSRRDERVSPEIAARIAVELLDALAYAHALRDFDGTPLEIVHRDVSPPNVFVCWDGSVKLLDFGIARAASRRASTDSGLIKGKFGYIAPEQASGEGTDRRADLWSVGVVLWEMLTGRRLFPARNDVGTLHALVAGTITPVTTHAPDAPPALVAVLERALQRDPDERFPSAEEMRDALTVWLDEQPRAVTRDDVAAWLGDAFVGERERQQALLRQCIGGARLGASATGSFHVASRGPSSESRKISTRPPPEPEKPRLAWGPIGFALVSVLALIGVAWRSSLDAPVDETTSASGTRANPAGASAAGTGSTTGASTTRASTTGASTTGASTTGASATMGGSATTGGNAARAANVTATSVANVTATSVASASVTNADAVDTNTVGSTGASGSAVPGSQTSGASATTSTGTSYANAARRGTTSARTARTAAAPAANVETPPVEPAPPAVAEETGWLSLDATPWATVALDGRSLGHTPLMRVEVPAGEHELVLENPERGIRRVYVVRVRPGETVRRRIAF
ncbi:MAG: protein kinase [Myxococcota bacterium]|nr:protein kinase [Myxococcota bacterium]